MVFFPTELKEILDDLSDPKLKVISEASIWLEEAVLVDGKEKTRGGEDLFEPKLYEIPVCSSFGWCWLLPESNGMMDGVGGSEDTPEDVETGKVKPLLLSEVNVHLCSGLVTEIEAKTGLFPRELDECFCRPSDTAASVTFNRSCPIASLISMAFFDVHLVNS